jgi:transglutaminase-like putative cysteine protease
MTNALWEASVDMGFINVRLGCQFEYITEPGAELIAIVEPSVVSGRPRCLYSERSVEPSTAIRTYQDVYGNNCWRVTAQGTNLTVRYDGVFEVSDEPDFADWSASEHRMGEIPDDAILFTLPSRYCQSDMLVQDAWSLFGSSPPGYAKVQAVCNWIHANVEYRTGSSQPSTTAVDTFLNRYGVCRDFAHLGVAFCRALSIPARYTFGYLPDYGVDAPDVPMDFHAWFEAYLGGRWYTFDARHNVPRIGRVKIAHGRDAVDTAIVTSYGVANLQSMTVWTDAEAVASGPVHELDMKPSTLWGAQQVRPSQATVVAQYPRSAAPAPPL